MADQDQFSDLGILPSIKSRELEFIGIHACCPGDDGRSRSRILHWIAVPVTIPIKTLNPKSILESPMIPGWCGVGFQQLYAGATNEVIGEVKKVIDEKFINRGLVVGHFQGSICCYIKVDGNDDMHAFPASFGLKGEALSSTSNVSLLKIVTKTHGKILTGKCLHLGIDDCRQDVGTTASSKETNALQPKVGVLQSLKKSLLRIALVHPNVSCNFVDIESEDDLLCTRVSPPPLPLLSSGFGIHLSSLIKLNASDGLFKLSGYISDINSRFVSKGPRHKLLNKIAMTFGSASDYEQRSRSQIYPLFLLNLNCPISLYDLTLEPSMYSVEFKVSVAIGIGTCYIKLYFLLGSGVSRDGLVLLMGERYALHQRHQNTAISDDMHAFPASFGFKGEALSSISDVYLLELLPKLMRGQMDIDGKCFCTLELMSVDKMIVQHSKYGLAFSERVSAKNFPCASSVSFKIVDIESEDDVLLLLLAAVVQWVWDSSEFP
ncbi:hypothetical protein KY290_016126 [Solanum tuberosum]|uniref:Uncharacterized protein n=1 Tax=Solanum tuberosum TaxID=4113 RepID=A0ABQ7VV40_SOLTU|nr:hypothetical protein KY290_016126 [Solanum tuberosum]